MQLTPRYGGPPIIELDGPPDAVLAPAVRQRRRLAATLADFDDAQWHHPSRCAGWTARDVIVHLDSTNSFWAFSIAAGVQGSPTTFLRTFDPVTSPAALVAGTDLPADEVFHRFVASNEALIAALEGLTTEEWTRAAEAPPGHISVSALVHHALWDSWVHERDILLPQHLPTAVEPDEVRACLRYAAALGPALAAGRGDTRIGSYAVRTSSPDVEALITIDGSVVVSAGAGVGTAAPLTLTGETVEVLEALSVRRSLDQPIAAEHAWMLQGVVDTFDAG
jgi:uncharacterized protein (TIGR03083 family)